MASSKQSRDMLVRIGVLAAIFAGYSSSGMSAGLGEVQRSFPAVPAETIMLLGTTTTVFNAISSFLVGVMQRWLSQKRVLCLGLLITFLGIAPVFFHESFPLLVAVFALVGFGTGMITGCGPAYISAHFKGEARVQMLGLKMSIQGVGSVLFSLLGGFLAVYGWWNTYLPFFVVGIALFMCVFMLPYEKPVREQAAEAESQKEEGEASADAVDLARREAEGLTLKSPLPIFTIAAACLFCMSGCIGNCISLHIEMNGMGNSMVSGIAMASTAVGMIIGGLAAPAVIKLLKTHTLTIVLAITAAAIAVGGITRSVVVLCLMMVVWGAMFGIYFGHVLNYLSGILKPSAVPMAMSLNAGISSGCAAMGIPLVNAVGVLYPIPSYTSGFFTIAAILAIVCVAVTVTGFEKKLASNML